MVFISRKVVYPIFVLIFAVAFFVLIYMVSFSQDLVVLNAQSDYSGDKLVLKMDINNISNHFVKDIEVLVVNGGKEDNYLISSLAPGEQYHFEEEFEITEYLHYDVYVKAPFNITKYFPIELKQNTVRPVLASVAIPSEMKVGIQYSPNISFMNVSESDISEVVWVTTSDGDYFEEDFFPRKFSLKSGESKSLPATFTPKAPGQVKLTFILKVGNIEYEQDKIITIVSE